MNKRILSILLGLVLVASLLVMAVPVGATPVMELRLLPDKTEANPGDTITYTVTLGPCQQIGSVQAKISLPEGLEYVSGSGKIVADHDAWDALEWVNSNMLITGGPTMGEEEGADYNYKSDSDTDLATFDVKVKDDATGELTATFVTDSSDYQSLEFGDIYTWEYITEYIKPVYQAVTIGSSAEPTDAPAEPTDAPAEPTDAPAEPTDAPAEPTDAPAEPTDAPAEPTEAPHEHNLTLVPEVPAGYDTPGTAAHYECAGCGKLFSDATGSVEVTAEDLYIAPWGPTEAPTEAPVPTEEPTDAPVVEPTDAPVEPTDAPAEPTDAPVEPTDAPVEPTDAPAVPTDAPAEPTDAPVVEPTDAPAVPTEAPEDPAAHVHELVFVEEVPATTETAGRAAHYECKGCDLMFLDAEGTQPVTEAELTLAPLPVVEPTQGPATPDEPTVAPTQAATSASTKDTATKTTISPKTGDSTHMTLWMFIMLASLVGVAVVLYAAKRKGIFTK